MFWMWASRPAGNVHRVCGKTAVCAVSDPCPRRRSAGRPHVLPAGRPPRPRAGRLVRPGLPPRHPGGGATWSRRAPSPPPSSPPSAGTGCWWGWGQPCWPGWSWWGAWAGVARVSERLVPAMALLYLGSGALVLLVRAEELPRAFALIFSCAPETRRPPWGAGAATPCPPPCATGWPGGCSPTRRGWGTSAMAHGAARADHPARQGMWGIFEVFVLHPPGVHRHRPGHPGQRGVRAGGGSPPAPERPGSPAPAWGSPSPPGPSPSVLGPRRGVGGGPEPHSLCLLLHSGGGAATDSRGCATSPAGDRFLPLYRAVFLGCIVLGAVSDVSPLWQLVDLCNALMALPNLTALLLLSPQALGCLRAWAGTQK